MSIIRRLSMMFGLAAMAASTDQAIREANAQVPAGPYGAPPEKRSEPGLIGEGRTQPSYPVDYAAKGMKEWDINGKKVYAATKKAAEKKAAKQS